MSTQFEWRKVGLNALLWLYVFFVPALAHAAVALPPTPLMSSVTPNVGVTSIAISGTNLSAAGATTTATLDSYPNLTLTTVTGTSVVATLPAGVPAGSYLLTLTVTNAKGPVFDEFWITLGTVGPQGPQGPQGLQGPPGVTGPAGPAGST